MCFRANSQRKGLWAVSDTGWILHDLPEKKAIDTRAVTQTLTSRRLIIIRRFKQLRRLLYEKRHFVLELCATLSKQSSFLNLSFAAPKNNNNNKITWLFVYWCAMWDHSWIEANEQWNLKSLLPRKVLIQITSMQVKWNLLKGCMQYRDPFQLKFSNLSIQVVCSNVLPFLRLSWHEFRRLEP